MVVILQVLTIALLLIQAVSKPSYVVEPLHPFTEYVFRVVWIFMAQLQLYSPSSPSYRTHPYGGMACTRGLGNRLFQSFGLICFYFKQ